MTRINVIITPVKVYATYVRTICFEQEFTDEFERADAIKTACAVAFQYGESFGSCMLNSVTTDTDWTADDVFNYLAKPLTL